VRDFGDDDKIALPAIKVSVQAVTLEMAVAQAFGRENCAELDHITLSLAPPRRYHRPHHRRRRVQQRLQRAALPATAARAARHPHRAQFLPRAGRPAQLHRRLGLAPLPRR
jgi:hypothetical protein